MYESKIHAAISSMLQEEAMALGILSNHHHFAFSVLTGARKIESVSLISAA